MFGFGALTDTQASAISAKIASNCVGPDPTKEQDPQCILTGLIIELTSQPCAEDRARLRHEFQHMWAGSDWEKLIPLASLRAEQNMPAKVCEGAPPPKTSVSTASAALPKWVAPVAITVGLIGLVAVLTGFASEKGRKLATKNRRRRR